MASLQTKDHSKHSEHVQKVCFALAETLLKVSAMDIWLKKEIDLCHRWRGGTVKSVCTIKTEKLICCWRILSRQWGESCSLSTAYNLLNLSTLVHSCCGCFHAVDSRILNTHLRFVRPHGSSLFFIFCDLHFGKHLNSVMNGTTANVNYIFDFTFTYITYLFYFFILVFVFMSVFFFLSITSSV